MRRQEAGRGGEQESLLLQRWGLQSAPRGRVRADWFTARRGAVTGEGLVLALRELRLLLVLLLVLFLTDETWRYVGMLAAPRLVFLIAGSVVAALVLIAVGLRRHLRSAATVRVPGAVEGEPVRSVVAPRGAHRRLVARVTGRVWLEMLTLGIVVAGLFALLGITTVDAELTRDLAGEDSVRLFGLTEILGEELVASAALLQVAGFLGALAAVVFAIEVLVDDEARHELIDDTVEDYSEAITVWAAGETVSARDVPATHSP